MIETMLLLASLIRPDRFVDAQDYLGRQDAEAPITLRAYLDALGSMEHQFNDICGDTFCEGEFGTIVSLGLTCSVDTDRRQVADCVWAFAGAEPAVSPESGHVVVRMKDFVCNLGFIGGIDDLAAFLAKPADAFSVTKIPGAGRTVYEVLTGCL